MDIDQGENAWNDIVDRIEAVEQALPVVEKFSAESVRHILLLIAEIARVLTISTEAEIRTVLGELNIRNDLKTFDKYLTILSEFSIIKRAERAKTSYVINEGTISYARLSLKRNSPYKTIDSWATAISESYRNRPNDKRSSVLKAFWNTGGSA
jgi:hypothetical protein